MLRGIEVVQLDEGELGIWDHQPLLPEAGLELLGGSLGEAGRTVVLEERLVGVEVSLFYACHGTNAVPLPNARDHKRLLDHDLGPNTGGMGAISPNPTMTPALEEEVLRSTIIPTLEYLTAEGSPFSGFLFAGFMLTAEGPRLLEYNVRLGDPETQAILPRLRDGDFLLLCQSVADGTIATRSFSFDPRATCAVVLAASGYPKSPRKGDNIAVDKTFETPDRWLVHAGTQTHNETLQTSGGRVAAVVARGDTPEDARRFAYEGIEMVSFAGVQTRTDIGAERALHPIPPALKE